mgnify:CR=1 FL=1
MTDTTKIRGWLDVFGDWDPTLAFVMAGAIVGGTALMRRSSISEARKAVFQISRDIETWQNEHPSSNPCSFGSLEELFKQITLHREKLQDKATGLWVHGYDSEYKGHFSFGSQLNWADKKTGKSAEIWGRGNGWVVVTISDLLTTMSIGTMTVQSR